MPSNKKKENVIYEDKYCKLTKKTLTIKWYYFPTAQNKHIEIEKITGVYYKEQVSFTDMLSLKGWGMSLSPCWWACDLLRGLITSDHFNVVIEVEGSGGFYCGFTVVDKNDFLAHLRALLKSSCHVKHGLPF